MSPPKRLEDESSKLQPPKRSLEVSIHEHVLSRIDILITSLLDAENLTVDHRRGIIARYTAVFEGNLIYWMTAAYLAVKSEEARSIIVENLTEEVRDCHPGMLRRFATAAAAFPTDADAQAISRELTNVRLFLGRLSGVQNLVMMAFLEGFVQRFMVYLADLAARQGSSEMEYTDVHGVCDVTHTQELFRALDMEMAVNPVAREVDVFEGVELLHALLKRIVHPEPAPSRADIAARYPTRQDAVTLLHEAMTKTASAIQSIDAGDTVSADDTLQHVRAALPELLCCRTLSDGFGAVINAIQSSFENQHGQPMTRAQISQILAALRRLDSTPTLSFDEAMPVIAELENAGLLVDPAAVEFIAEWLSG